MRLKDAKEQYGVSSTYFYKLKTKSNGDNKEFVKLLEEYKVRKADRNSKVTETK